MLSHLDKLLFAKHLAMMIKAGLPLREGVATIQEQTRSRKFKRTLDNVIKRLDNGESLAQSLTQHGKLFDQLFINMIKVGEESGTLEKNLEYLAEQLEKSYNLKRKVIAAMIYPAVILFSTFILGAALAIFILPKLIPLFKSLRVNLPLSTRILLFVTELIQNYGLFVLLGIAVFLILAFLISRIKIIRLINYKILLRIPIAGTMSKNLNLSLFSRTLGTLIKSGVSIVEALDISANTLTNLVYNKEAKQVSLKVQNGKQISTYLKTKSRLFPATFSRMVKVGEKTGNLEESLLYLADFYEKEVDNTTQKLSTILEPVLLIIIGLIVGFIAISIITPIYQITKGLRG
jgi:type II secretory pathway component PulF